MASALRLLLAALLPLLVAGARAPLPIAGVPAHAWRAACGSPSLRGLAAGAGASVCTGAMPQPVPMRPVLGAPRPAAVPAATGDGTLVGRTPLAKIGPVGLDLVAYLSSGLIVGGLLCYVDDGTPRPTILHLHGGFGGIFVNPDGGDIVGTCYRWAADTGHTAFVPSFRGQDGFQGTPELCLGEVDDVAAAAVMLRGLSVVDPDRLALVGGSMGGCVALRAGTRIPNLRAVVAIAPPTDFKALVTYHRTAYVPATETRCDGSTVAWNTGGPVFADTIDDIVCGHPGCSDADYAVRSPLPEAASATNPTLVLAAGADNLVPTQQQLMWSALRNVAGGSVVPDIRDRCSDAAAPPLQQDVLLYVPGAFHLMENGPLYSGLLYLLDLLDPVTAPAPPAL